MTRAGCDGSLRTTETSSCWVDEDGVVLFVVEHEAVILLDASGDADFPRVTCRRLAGRGDDEPSSLSDVEACLPPEFEGFWDA